MVRGDWVLPGVVFIDVGMNRISADGDQRRRVKGVGVAFSDASEVASAITPAAGGVVIWVLSRTPPLPASSGVSRITRLLLTLWRYLTAPLFFYTVTVPLAISRWLVGNNTLTLLSQLVYPQIHPVTCGKKAWGILTHSHTWRSAG